MSDVLTSSLGPIQEGDVWNWVHNSAGVTQYTVGHIDSSRGTMELVRNGEVINHRYHLTTFNEMAVRGKWVRMEPAASVTADDKVITPILCAGCGKATGKFIATGSHSPVTYCDTCQGMESRPRRRY